MMLAKLIPAISLLGFLTLCHAQPALAVQGLTNTTVALSAEDLSRLPQQTISVVDHGATVEFQGVRLADVLNKVDLPTGEKFHKTAASYYLLVEAKDGYRAVFAWAELDPSFTDKAIFVATKRDGKPLTQKDGPFQLIAPGEKRGARWVRQVTALKIKSGLEKQ